MPRTARPKPQIVTINGKQYVCSQVQRVQVDDWPQPVPSSGRQGVTERYLRQTLQLSNITNAFAGEWLLSTPENDEHLAHGHIHTLYDSNCETRFGSIMKGRRNNSTTDSLADSDLFGATNNDRPAIVLNGQLYMFSYNAASAADSQAHSWGGSSWSVANRISNGTDPGTVYDWCVIGATVFAIRTLAGDNQVLYSTTPTVGAWAAATQPAAGAVVAGRIYSDGVALYYWFHTATTSGTLYRSTNSGTSWTSLGGYAGKVMSVGQFFDLNGNSRVVFITADALYYTDNTNVYKLWNLPHAGRSIVSMGGSLLIFMDGMRVWLYSPDGTTVDVSPGGGQRMPADKAFSYDSGSQVCTWQTGLGVYAMWTGDNSAGTVLAPLVLMFDPNTHGWHFIVSPTTAANTNANNAGRYLAVDPVLDHLVYGVRDDSDANETNHGYTKSVDVNPELMSTMDNLVADSTFTTQRTNLGDPSVTKTAWLYRINSTLVDSTETLTLTYGIDGVAPATALSAITSNNGNTTFGTNAVGVSFTDIATIGTLASTDQTLSPKIVDLVLEYQKIPTTRWMYVFTIELEATSKRRSNVGINVITSELRDNVVGSKVKLAVSYAYETGLYLLPLARSQVVEKLTGLADAKKATSIGQWTIAMVEA